MRKTWHENLMHEIYIFMHENDISWHENDVSVHENKIVHAWKYHLHGL